MTAETNNQPLLIVPALTAKIEEAIDLLCAAYEAHQIDTTTSAKTLNALCDAFAFITSGDTVAAAGMAKMNGAAQQIDQPDTDEVSVDRNWVE